MEEVIVVEALGPNLAVVSQESWGRVSNVMVKKTYVGKVLDHFSSYAELCDFSSSDIAQEPSV